VARPQRQQVRSEAKTGWRGGSGVVFGLCFVEFLSLFTGSLSYLIQGCSLQLTNRVQSGVGID
jgi:hypothetical protein